MGYIIIIIVECLKTLMTKDTTYEEAAALAFYTKYYR
jgi:hypothetical protein